MAAPNQASTERIGDLLVREGLITEEQLDKALQEQQQNGTRVGYNLVKLGFVQEIELTKMLARQYKMPAVDLSRFEVDPKIAKLIPARSRASKNLVLPLKRDGRTLTVAMADPTNLGVIEDLKFITRYDIFPVIAGEFTLRNADREDLRGRPTTQQMASLDGHHQRARATRSDVEVVEEKEEEVSAGGARGADGRRAGREADQRDPHRRREARRVGHPLRVLRARAPRALPHRRRAAGSHEAADEDARRRSSRASRSCRRSTSPSAACRRTAASS